VLKSLKWGFPDARISPDGRFVAYTTPTDGPEPSDIFLLATDGSSETTVVQHPARDYGMVWASDGSKLLFLSDRTGSPSLWAVPVQSGKAAGPAELVKTNFDAAQLLGMGSNGLLYYAVSGSTKNIYRAELNSDGKVSHPPAIVTDSFVNANQGGDISKDGKLLAYYSFRPQPTLVVKTLETGVERVVPTTLAILMTFQDSNAGRGPRWFPDGRSVLVVASENDRPGNISYRVDVTTGRAEEILREVPHSRAVKPAPVGNAIYDRAGDPRRLVRHDLNTGRSANVVSASVFIRSFSVSPDGSLVAYIADDPDRYIAIVPATGGEPREVYRSRDIASLGSSNWNSLEWSPDQEYLLFVRLDPSGRVISRVPVTGGPPENIGISMNAVISQPLLHPDGKGIFFTAQTSRRETWALENFLPEVPAAK
jgi:Tol biopolymer transport system component